jgi:hypothetical protein
MTNASYKPVNSHDRTYVVQLEGGPLHEREFIFPFAKTAKPLFDFKEFEKEHRDFLRNDTTGEAVISQKDVWIVPENAKVIHHYYVCEQEDLRIAPGTIVRYGYKTKL